MPEQKESPQRTYRSLGERRRIVAEIQQRRQLEGRSLTSLFNELGINPKSYYNWLRADNGGGLVPVEIVSFSQDKYSPRFTVVAPSGYRVEDLSLESTAALLRLLA